METMGITTVGLVFVCAIVLGYILRGINQIRKTQAKMEEFQLKLAELEIQLAVNIKALSYKSSEK